MFEEGRTYCQSVYGQDGPGTAPGGSVEHICSF